MRQAGRAEVDVLLQPSNTWGPVGEYHFRNNALRAVENGFTHVRCSAGGYSGVATPLYSFVHHVATLNQKTVLFTVPLRPRVRTFYVAAGYLFEVMNLAAAAALLVLAAIPRPTAARLLPWLAADTAPQHDSLPGSEPNILRDERVQLL